MKTHRIIKIKAQSPAFDVEMDVIENKVEKVAKGLRRSHERYLDLHKVEMKVPVKSSWGRTSGNKTRTRRVLPKNVKEELGGLKITFEVVGEVII
jgi:hypothetical protein